MKNTIKAFAIIALVAVIGFSFAACDTSGGGAPAAQKVTYTGIAGDGTTYKLEITENTARYAAQSGDAYKLTVGVNISTGTVSANVNGVLTLVPSKSGQTTFTITVSVNGITAMTGTITFDDNTTASAPTGTWSGDWTKWGDAITFSVGANGLVTVNITQPAEEMDTCAVQLPYAGVKNKTYRYIFEAWTESGTRDVRVCFGSEVNKAGGVWYPNEVIKMSSKKQTFELEYDISNAWADFTLSFNCGGDIGKFYLNIISIDTLR